MDKAKAKAGGSMPMPPMDSDKSADSDETSSESEQGRDRAEVVNGPYRDGDGKGGSVCPHGRKKHMCRECTAPPLKLD